MISLMKSRIEENKKNVGGANVSSYIPMTCRATNKCTWTSFDIRVTTLLQQYPSFSLLFPVECFVLWRIQKHAIQMCPDHCYFISFYPKLCANQSLSLYPKSSDTEFSLQVPRI